MLTEEAVSRPFLKRTTVASLVRETLAIKITNLITHDLI